MNLTVNLATYRACFWQSNQIYFLDIKEKLKRQALPDSWKWNKTTLLFANPMAPYTGKAKPYHNILFLYATSSRPSLVQVATEKITYKQSNYINNIAFNHFLQRKH